MHQFPTVHVSYTALIILPSVIQYESKTRLCRSCFLFRTNRGFFRRRRSHGVLGIFRINTSRNIKVFRCVLFYYTGTRTKLNKTVTHALGDSHGVHFSKLLQGRQNTTAIIWGTSFDMFDLVVKSAADAARGQFFEKCLLFRKNGA